ncbi:MAG: adenine deaminase C-terminal domain-containing protein, partial [Actinomycetota bacterium]
HGPERCAFCTDDREPDFLVREGHINHMCRLAVAHGVAPEDALLLASLHAARYHGLTDMGAIAPGYKADFSLMPDLESFRPVHVFKEGRPVVRDGRVVDFGGRDVPVWVRRSVRNAPVEASDLEIACDADAIRIIEVIPGQLLTRMRVEPPALSGALAVADPDRDLAKIVVVERHHGTGRIGKGFVTGFGLQHGAFASTVAHDAHNIVVVGTSDEDMAECIARVQAMGGGIVAVEGGRVAGELALPVAGLLSDEPYETVVGRLDDLHDALEALGVKISSPFMTLSFLALSVIPSLKITDLGLIDVDRFEIVPLEVPAGGND